MKRMVRKRKIHEEEMRKFPSINRKLQNNSVTQGNGYDSLEENIDSIEGHPEYQTNFGLDTGDAQNTGRGDNHTPRLPPGMTVNKS